VEGTLQGGDADDRAVGGRRVSYHRAGGRSECLTTCVLV